MEDVIQTQDTELSENGHMPVNEAAPEISDAAAKLLADPAVPEWIKGFVRMAEEMPEEERKKFPPDYSENLDYYLYGMPKKSPEPSDAAPSVERNAPMATTSEKDELAIGNDKQPANPEDGSGPPAFVKRLIKMSENMSQEDRDKFPPDYSENLDHYLYGTPKKSP